MIFAPVTHIRADRHMAWISCFVILDAFFTGAAQDQIIMFIFGERRNQFVFSSSGANALPKPV